MKSYWHATISIVIVFAAVIGLQLAAAAVEHSVPPGSKVIVDVIGDGEPEAVVAVVGDKPVAVKLPAPAEDVLLTPTTQPTTQPTTKPVPEYDFVVRKGQSLPSSTLLGGGTYLDPIVVAVERGGVWNGSLSLNRSHVYYVAFGEGPKPLFKSATGIRVSSNISNVMVRGFAFDASGVALNSKGNGIAGSPVDKVRDITFEDNTFIEHWNGFSIHPKVQGDESLYWKNVTISYNRFIDPKGNTSHSGHGGYIEGVNGLVFYENGIFSAGRNKSRVDIFAHGLYSQAGILDAVYERNLIGWAESAGMQVRGPDRDSKNRKHDSDPGPIVIGNVVVDAAVGLIVNGRTVTVRKNIVSDGHFHNATKDGRRVQWHGEGGIQVHAGFGPFKDNTRFLHGAPEPLPGEYRMPAFDLSPRQPKEGNLWPWGFSTAGVDQGNNVNSPARVSFDDLIQRGRAGEPIGRLVDEAHARAAAAR